MSDHYSIAEDCLEKHAKSLINQHQNTLIEAKLDSSTQELKCQSWTYGQIHRLSNRVANLFAKLGLKPQARVLIRLPNEIAFPLSFFGSLRVGAIPIPSSPVLKEEELRYQLEHSQSEILITTPDLLPDKILAERPSHLRHIILITASKKTIVPFGTLSWANLLYEASSDFASHVGHSEDPAYWLYTSGTTGAPKAVVHAHRSIPAHDARARQWQDLQLGDVIFNTSALNWSYALTAGFLDVWRHGLTSVIYSGPLESEKILQVVRKCRVTTLMSVPGIYHRLLKEPDLLADGFRQVRVCVSAGEKLRQETRDSFENVTGLKIYEGLGMTEHSVYLVQPYGEPIVPDSCGRPLPNTKIKILNETLEEMAIGTVGILASHQSSPGLFLGYQEADKCKGELQEGWFLSGDLARQDEAGNVFFLGRADDVLTAGGYRISPLEVEQILQRHPAVAEAAVFQASSPSGQNILKAAVVLKPDGEPDPPVEKTLIFYCQKFLADYKVPKAIVVLTALPKTSNGKLKRKEIAGTLPANP